MLWKRWTREYLPTLVTRKKWTVNTRNLKIGDLVILSIDNSPQSHWPLGRVIDIYPGNDGIVCSVKIKTPNTELIRPSAKLSLFEAAT